MDHIFSIGQVGKILGVQPYKIAYAIEVGQLPQVEADSSQMRQLFQNLIGNALKFRKKDVAPVITITSQVTQSHQLAVPGPAPTSRMECGVKQPHTRSRIRHASHLRLIAHRSSLITPHSSRALCWPDIRKYSSFYCWRWRCTRCFCRSGGAR